MRTISRRLRKLEVVLAPQEEGPSIAEILRAGRWPSIAGGESVQVASSKTVAQPRTTAEIVRYRRQIRLAQEAGASGERGRGQVG
jgi:hypothetical protein